MVTSSPSPWQLRIYLLSLWVCLFWMFQVIQHVSFCVWLLSLNIMFSRSMHVVACVRDSSLSVAE